MRYANWIIKYRWLVAVVTLVVMISAAAGITKLGFSTDARVFFSESDPRLESLNKLEAIYNKDDSVIFVLAASPGDADIFTRKTLSAIINLTEASWQIPYSSRADSLTNLQHTTVEEDDLIVADLVTDPNSLSETELEKIKDIALNEPIIIDWLISKTGHVAGVQTTIVKPLEGPDVTTEIAIYIDKMAEEFRKANPDIPLYVTGTVSFDQAFAAQSQNDPVTLIPLMFIVMVIFLLISFRSLTATLITVVVIVLSALSAMGLAGWLGIVLTSPSAMAPVIILTLAVADSVHIITATFRKMGEGESRRDALRYSLDSNFWPVIITSLTTAAGFLSLNSSDSTPFRDLGNISAMGVSAALLNSLLLLPALIAILPFKVSLRKANHSTIAERIGVFVVAKRKFLFIATPIVMLFVTVGISQITLDDNFRHYFDESYVVRTDADFIEENLMGLDVLEFSIDAGGEGAVNEPAYLKRLEAFTAWWYRQPKVAHVSSIVDIHKKLNRTMHEGNADYYKIPETRELAAQYLLLYEMSLPYGMDLNNQIDLDKTSSRLRVYLNGASAKDIRALEADGNAWIDAHPQGAGIEATRATGLSIIFSHISETNIHNMLGGTLTALLIISLMLAFIFRSLRLGLISLVPNIIPALMAFGLWGYVFGEVGLAVSVVTAISLGIVVDDTVHIMAKYLRARRAGVGPEEAVRHSIRNAGSAVITTSVILIAGFAVMTLSGFTVNSSMGILTASAVAFALLADLLFLPPLLIFIDKR